MPKDKLRGEMTKLNLGDSDNFWSDIIPTFLSLQTHQEVHNKLETLWEAVVAENLEFENVLAQKENISSLISRLSLVNTPSDELSSAFHELIQCIQPLNVQLMISLIEDFDTAAQMIAEKDIVLIFGETGSGKSTTIHFLAKSVMVETILNGFTHIQPTQISGNVSRLKVGVSTQSVTKSITAVELENGMIICDTPGFGETAGPERMELGSSTL
jgi:ribosome biogenesis GTPase A